MTPAGVPPSFSECYAARFPAIAGQLALYLGSAAEAEEVTQEAFTRAWVRWLPPNQRRAVVLHYLAGPPVAEVADLCQAREGARARQATAATCVPADGRAFLPHDATPVV